MFDSASELLKQIQYGEDSCLELKELVFKGGSVYSPDNKSIADELAAMANSNGGVLVLGVQDKTKSISGIPVDKLDIVESWIRQICNDLINPQLFCSIRKVGVTDKDETEKVIIRVDVNKSLFVHQSSGGYFTRIGSSKRKMPPDMLARLFQQRSQTRIIRFDEQLVPEATIDDLDKKLWSKFRTPLSPENDYEFLIKLKLVSEGYEDKLAFPTVSGILLGSQEPQRFLPNAFIQAVAYSGDIRDAATQIDARDIKGPLDSQIIEACHFVKRNMMVRAGKKEFGRYDIPQYSMRAVFEAVVNAVAHRDYSIYGSKIRLHMFSDRLELSSPGAIPNSMTIESMPLRQASRNELISSLLARCTVADSVSDVRTFMMDKRGEGVPIILSESEKLSGKRPIYKLIDDAELMLTIYSA